MNKQSSITQPLSTGANQEVPQTTPEPIDQPKNSEKQKEFSTGKKAYILTVLFIAVAILVLAATILYKGVKLTKYSSDSQRFSISYPEGWVIDETKDGSSSMSTTFSEPYDATDTSVGFANPAILTVEKIDANAGGQKLAKETFFDSYSSIVTDAVKKGKDETIPDAEYPASSSQSEAKIDGYDAVLIEADVENFQYIERQQGKKYTALIWVNDSLQYTVVLGVHSSDKNLGEQWDSILASFKVNQ